MYIYSIYKNVYTCIYIQYIKTLIHPKPIMCCLASLEVRPTKVQEQQKTHGSLQRRSHAISRCVYTYTHTHTSTCTRAHAHKHTRTHEHARTRTHTHTLTHTHMYTHTLCTYICTHTHTHTIHTHIFYICVYTYAKWKYILHIFDFLFCRLSHVSCTWVVSLMHESLIALTFERLYLKRLRIWVIFRIYESCLLYMSHVS